MSGYRIAFKPTAVKDLKKLPITVRRRIAAKLDYYRQQPDPLAYAVKLTGFNQGGNYRFRVGQYQVVFDVNKDEITVLYVEHRREVYRRK